MGVKLDENSTHEDIQKAVDHYAQQNKDNSEAGDAAAIAEEREEAVVPEVAQAVDDDTSGQSVADGEVVAEEEAGLDWVDDDVRSDVSAYGIGDEELAAFANRDEFDRAMRLFDKGVQDAGRKAMSAQEDQGGAVRDEQGRFAKKEPEPLGGDGEGYEPKFADWWDEDAKEDLGRELKTVASIYEGRLAELESRIEGLIAESKERMFDHAIDAMGHPDIFGKTGSETEEELSKREKVMVATEAQMLGLERMGRKPGSYEKIVERMGKALFADEFLKKEIKHRTKKLQKQHDGRIGGASAKAPPPEESPRDKARRLFKELGGDG